jgi:predicted nuclease of predicted toxin-antitoxin system
MSGLFIEFYLDEDVDVLVADLVRARGFSAITTQEAGNVGATDRQQLAAAVSMQKTFVTHNRADFELLAEEYFVSGHQHYGIVIAVRRSPYQIVLRLLAILNNVSADEMKDQLRYI